MKSIVTMGLMLLFSAPGWARPRPPNAPAPSGSPSLAGQRPQPAPQQVPRAASPHKAAHRAAVVALRSCREMCLGANEGDGVARLSCFDQCVAQHGKASRYKPFLPCHSEAVTCRQSKCGAAPRPAGPSSRGAADKACPVCFDAHRACMATVLATATVASASLVDESPPAAPATAPVPAPPTSAVEVAPPAETAVEPTTDQ